MSDFREFIEQNVSTGLGKILAVKKPSQTKYQIVFAVPSIPSVSGNKNTVDYSTTSNKTITKIGTKRTTNDVEVTFPMTLDNDRIAKEISDLELPYAIIDLETGLGWEFVAVASYRFNDINPENPFEGSLQLTPSYVNSASTRNMLEFFMDTITFETMPARITLSSTAKTPQTINVVTDPTTATLTVESDTTGIAAAQVTDKEVKITPVAKGSCYVTISATATDYASYSHEIYVVVE